MPTTYIVGYSLLAYLAYAFLQALLHCRSEYKSLSDEGKKTYAYASEFWGTFIWAPFLSIGYFVCLLDKARQSIDRALRFLISAGHRK